jgi:hypothetical protein
MATLGFGTVGFFRTLQPKSPSPLTVRIRQNAVRFGVAPVVLSVADAARTAIARVSTLCRHETAVLGQ